MTPEKVEGLFTRSDGQYMFARWGRPIAPVVFGVDEPTLRVVKGALEAVVALAGHKMAETDPELGANLMLFFFRDWSELPGVPNLDKLVPDLAGMCERLAAKKANQFRIFRFDPTGAIKVAFVFLRMDEHLSIVPVETLALSQAVQVILAWSDQAFAKEPPLMISKGGKVILRPEIAGVIRAGYDPVLPGMARDTAHALRLSARVSRVA